jgi:hypothetical protein
MGALNILVMNLFDGHKTHVGTGDGLHDRRRIVGVVLLALHVRLNELGRHDPNGESQLFKLPGPIMRPRTGFHAYHLRPQLEDNLLQPTPPYDPAKDLLAPFIHAVERKNLLCQINP